MCLPWRRPPPRSQAACQGNWAWLVVTLLESDQALSPLSVVLHSHFHSTPSGPRSPPFPWPNPDATLMLTSVCSLIFCPCGAVSAVPTSASLSRHIPAQFLCCSGTLSTEATALSLGRKASVLNCSFPAAGSGKSLELVPSTIPPAEKDALESIKTFDKILQCHFYKSLLTASPLPGSYLGFTLNLGFLTSPRRFPLGKS